MYSRWIDECPTTRSLPDEFGVQFLSSIVRIVMDEIVPSLRWILGGLQLKRWNLLKNGVPLIIPSVNEEYFISAYGETTCQRSATRSGTDYHIVVFWGDCSRTLVGGPVSSTTEEVSYH